MTDRYTFAPLLVDASPIPSRFAAPLDSGAGGAWLDGCAALSLPMHDVELILRPRRRGQRPAGTTRSAWFSLRRGERRLFGGVP